MAVTWFIVGTVLAVLAIGGHLLTRGWPVVPKLLFATGLLVAAPTLVAQGLIGTAWIFDQIGPVSGLVAWLVLLLPAAAVAGLLGLLRGVPWFDLGRIPLGSVAVLLAVFAVVTAPLLALGISTGEPQRAEHTWTMTLTPGDGVTPYVVEVPFVVTSDPADAGIVERLREQVAVERGAGEVQPVRDGTWLRVEATGPVTVSARHAYYGPIGAREAMNSATLPAANATWSAEGNLSLALEVAYSFSGGTGHTCWTDGRLIGQAPAPGQLALDLDDHGDRTPLWRVIHGDGGLPTVCA